jgi:hypothetical protein
MIHGHGVGRAMVLMWYVFDRLYYANGLTFSSRFCASGIALLFPLDSGRNLNFTSGFQVTTSSTCAFKFRMAIPC